VQHDLTELPTELLRRDVRDPHLEPGEDILLDFTVRAKPGDIVLVKRDGTYALAIAPAPGRLIAVVKLAS
jgi:phage repressor protein C with HTH and peptisase S24 domain